MRKFIVLAVILYLAQQSICLGYRWVDDESWYLIPAETLLKEGRFRIPVFNDTSREFFSAAPLLSALEAVSWSIREITPVQARLLAVAFGVGTILVTYALARRLFDESVAAIAALLCSVENMLFLTGRSVRPEIVVTFFTVMAMWLLLKSVQDQTLWPLALAGLSVGLGITAHPNGGAASLCGVLLLWFFEGWSFVRRRRIYLFTFWCILGVVPLVSFWIWSDASTGFKGFGALLHLHSLGGPTLLERLTNSMVGEVTERYAGFVVFPYRVHLAVLSVAAVVIGLFRRNRATRFAACCVIVHLLFFAFVTKYCKSPRYLTLAMPFVTILWAEWIGTLVSRAATAGSPSGRRRASVLAGALCLATGFSQLAGNAGFLWKFRHANASTVCREIESMIPPHSTLYGSMTFWIYFRDHMYVPYTRMPWIEAIEEFNPNIVILDDQVMVKGSYPGEWDALRGELHEYVSRHGTLLGTVENDYYGDLKIYEVARP